MRRRAISDLIFKVVSQDDMPVDKDGMLANALKLCQKYTLSLNQYTDDKVNLLKENLIEYIIRTNNVRYFKYIFNLISLDKYKTDRGLYDSYIVYEFALNNKLSDLCMRMIRANYFYDSNYLLYAFQTTYKNNEMELVNTLVTNYSTLHKEYDKYLTKYICTLKNETLIQQFISYEDNYANIGYDGYIELLLTTCINNNFNYLACSIIDRLTDEYIINTNSLSGLFLFNLLNYDKTLFDKYWKHVVANHKVYPYSIYKSIYDFTLLLCLNQYVDQIKSVLTSVSMEKTDRLKLYNDYSNSYVQTQLYSVFNMLDLN